jgi:hypothetical protein
MSSPNKIRCPVCGKLLSRRYFKTHEEKFHQRIYTVPSNIDLSVVYDFEFNDKEFEESLESLMKSINKKRDYPEERVQKKLEAKTGYTHKKCETGIIDLFSERDKIIIEIKRWSLYKHALGQLLAYKTSYPDYQLQVHFFGKIPKKENLIRIVSVFSEHLIQVTWEFEN